MKLWIASVNRGSAMKKELQNDGVRSRKKIYDFLVKFITENGYSPSIREICEGTGLHSTSTIYKQLMTLEMMGKIHTKERKSRTISLVGFQFVKAG